MRWEPHLDFERGLMLLPGTKTSKSRRRISIPPVLLPILEASKRSVGPIVEPWLNVRRDLHAASVRAGIQHVSPNNLRRTFASWLKQ